MRERRTNQKSREIKIKVGLYEQTPISVEVASLHKNLLVSPAAVPSASLTSPFQTFHSFDNLSIQTLSIRFFPIVWEILRGLAGRHGGGGAGGGHSLSDLYQINESKRINIIQFGLDSDRASQGPPSR